MQTTKVPDTITRRAADLPWVHLRIGEVDGKRQWVPVGEGEPWEMRSRLMMSPADDETLYMSCVDVAPGWREPTHYHTRDEMCYIVAGTIETGGQTFVPGDVIHTKANVQYSLRAGAEGATFLVIRAGASRIVTVEEGWTDEGGQVADLFKSAKAGV